MRLLIPLVLGSKALAEMKFLDSPTILAQFIMRREMAGHHF